MVTQRVIDHRAFGSKNDPALVHCRHFPSHTPCVGILVLSRIHKLCNRAGEGKGDAAYAADRQKAKAANASINWELAALKRMFSLAVEDGRLSHGPYIPTLEEDNARQGFVDHAAFVSLRANLSEYLRDPITFLYLSGWRLGRDEGARMARC